MNHLNEEQFVLYYYGEGDGATAVRAHLDSCEACRAEYASLQRVLNVVDSVPVPERDASYGTQVWNRLQPSLKWDRPGGLSWWPARLWPARHWAAATLVATLVVAAFLAGRYYPKAQSGGQTANAGQVRERILLVAVGDHLERSQTVLLELVNAQPGQSLDVASERERAGDLVAENRLYRQTGAHRRYPGGQRVGRVGARADGNRAWAGSAHAGRSGKPAAAHRRRRHPVQGARSRVDDAASRRKGRAPGRTGHRPKYLIGKQNV